MAASMAAGITAASGDGSLQPVPAANESEGLQNRILQASLRRTMSLIGTDLSQGPIEEDPSAFAGSLLLLAVALACLVGTMIFFILADRVLMMHTSASAASAGGLKAPSRARSKEVLPPPPSGLTDSNNHLEGETAYRPWTGDPSSEQFPERPLGLRRDAKRVSFQDLAEVCEETERDVPRRLLPPNYAADYRPFPHYGGTDAARLPPPSALRGARAG